MIEWLHVYEIQVNLFLQSFGPWLVAPTSYISFLGQMTVFQAIFPALLWTVSANLGIALGLVLLMNSFVNDFFKFLFHASRPYWINPAVHAYSIETSFGVPSGHAQNSASLMTFLALTLRRRWVTFLTVVIILAVGFSRIYLGAHYLSDVIVGWVFGILVALLIYKNYTSLIARVNRLTFRTQVFLALATSLLLIGLCALPDLQSRSFAIPADWAHNAAVNNHGIPLEPFDMEDVVQTGGTWFGLLAGAAWLKRTHGSFDVQGTILQRLARLAVGLTVLTLLRYAATIILPDPSTLAHYITRYIVYTLIGLWTTFGAPLVFVHLRLSRFSDEVKPVPFLGYLEKSDTRQ